MKKKILILGACMLVLTGCGEKTIPKLKDGSEAVVTLNDGKDIITVNDLYTEMKDSYALQVLINLVDRKILEVEYKDSMDEAKSNAENTVQTLISSYGSEDEVVKLLQQNTPYRTLDEYKDALVLAYLQNEVILDYAKDKITDKQIKKYYDDEIEGDIKVSHILFTSDASEDATDDEKEEAKKKAKEEAENALNELKDLKGNELKDKFAELAKKSSDDESSKEDGGNLGFINKGTLGTSYANIETAAYKLKDGELYGEVVETSIGYHLVLRTESKEKAKLDEVKDSIIEELSEEYITNNNDAQIKALQELRKKHGMDIIDDEIQSQYAAYIQNALLAAQTSNTTN